MDHFIKAIFILMALCPITSTYAQPVQKQRLDHQQQSIVHIAAHTAVGDLTKLEADLTTGLEAGLTINQIKEILVHVYAYAGFPRSIRGLQTFMRLLDKRKAAGIFDNPGAESTPITDPRSKYDRGKSVLDSLLGAPQTGPKTGYSAFAPIIEVFLKEHLFADIFERDVLSYQQRELATISMLASITRVEPMLQSHLKICLNMGLKPHQLEEFIAIIKTDIGKKEAKSAQQVLNQVIKNSSKN